MDKVQIHSSSNIFTMWRHSGGRDWRPLLRGVLGNNIVRKIEMISRNAYLRGPKSFWTYGGDATSIGTLVAADKFNLAIVNAWNFRLGNTGSPVIPGTSAGVRVAICPPALSTTSFPVSLVQPLMRLRCGAMLLCIRRN